MRFESHRFPSDSNGFQGWPVPRDPADAGARCDPAYLNGHGRLISRAISLHRIPLLDVARKRSYTGGRLFRSVGKDRPEPNGIVLEDETGAFTGRFNQAHDESWPNRVPHQVSWLHSDRAMSAMFNCGMLIRERWELPAHTSSREHARWIHGLHELSVLKAEDVGLREQMDSPHQIAQSQRRHPQGNQHG